jgi:hypothetical protein
MAEIGSGCAPGPVIFREIQAFHGPEHGVAKVHAQAPLTGIHHPSLAAVKAGGATMANRGKGSKTGK